MTDLVVYARTSGDEADTGQDVKAQASDIVTRVALVGHNVLAWHADDGVSGDTDPFGRPGFLGALQLARRTGAALVVREVSRFSRAHPAQALLWWNALDVPVLCLTEDHFTTLGRDQAVEPARELLRFVTLWQSWSELLGIRSKTKTAMAALKREGKPNGRPPVYIDPAHLDHARKVMAAGGTLAEAHRQVLELRGYTTALDPKTKAKRNLGLTTLGAALGLPAYLRKPRPSQTPAALPEPSSGANGSVVEGA